MQHLLSCRAQPSDWQALRYAVLYLETDHGHLRLYRENNLCYHSCCDCTVAHVAINTLHYCSSLSCEAVSTMTGAVDAGLPRGHDPHPADHLSGQSRASLWQIHWYVHGLLLIKLKHTAFHFVTMAIICALNFAFKIVHSALSTGSDVHLTVRLFV